MKKIGFLGPEGTFCEEASFHYTKRIKEMEKIKKVELIPYATIHELLFAVNRGEINEGITPIENSIEGSVTIVQDMLVKDVNLKIKYELIIPVHHYLLAHKGIKLSEITDVISHPQAIDQCQDFLRKKLPKVQIYLSHSTAEAVRQVALAVLGINIRGRKVFAAIGTEAAGKLYGLKVLASQINDYKDNFTRFVVLTKSDHPRTGNDKTSIVFSLRRDRPGGLHDILGELAIRNINLTKIESRPSKKALGDYYFFVDMQGHRTDRIITETLADIKRKAPFLKVLGSYPRAKM